MLRRLAVALILIAFSSSAFSDGFTSRKRFTCEGTWTWEVFWGGIPWFTNRADLQRADTSIGNPPSGDWTTYFALISKPRGDVAPALPGQWYRVKYYLVWPIPLGTTSMCWVPWYSSCGGHRDF